MSTVINVSRLTKQFTLSVTDPNRSWFKNAFFPKKKIVTAVRSCSFKIKAGERVAFIGPNGAGKSTMIKMLTGIIHPTSGSCNVLGKNPQTEIQQLAYSIGTVFGQRSQLFPNLPLVDSLEYFGVMYDLSDEKIKDRIKELVELFDMSEFLDQPVRKLSLGQRMRAEVACALIHEPKIIFLDEPTIGLDVVAKKSLRELLLKLNRQEGTTIFLTSHDVGDIEFLCERTMIMNHGEIIKDLPTKDLVKEFAEEHIEDLNDASVDLESVIRHLYEAASPRK